MLFAADWLLQTLETEKFAFLRESAEVVEADRFGEKVLRLADGTYLKLFRRKRLLTSAAWYPYAQRFADNAEALRCLGIPCPQVIGVFRLPEISRDMVHYRPLPGATVRQLIGEELAAEHAAKLRMELGAFIASLHEAGVYFRSLHLGNVVHTAEGAFGLIDLADLKFARRPLSTSQRQRNFRHLLRYRSDQSWLLADGGTSLIKGYLRCAPDALPEAMLRKYLS